MTKLEKRCAHLGKVWSYLSPSLEPALLLQSLQGRFACQNSEGPRAREKVVWKGPASKERSGLICR